MVSPFDAGVRGFRGHCCRIHRISTELEWSQRVPEFGYCGTGGGSVLACDSRQSVAVAITDTEADEARSCWRAKANRAECIAQPEAKAGCEAEGEAQGQAEAKAHADAHTKAEAHADAQGRKPLHPRAARDARAQESAVPAGRTDHDCARRAGRGGRPELHPALRLAGYEPFSSIQLWNHMRSTQPPTNGTVRALRIGQK